MNLFASFDSVINLRLRASADIAAPVSEGQPSKNHKISPVFFVER